MVTHIYNLHLLCYILVSTVHVSPNLNDIVVTICYKYYIQQHNSKHIMRLPLENVVALKRAGVGWRQVEEK